MTSHWTIIDLSVTKDACLYSHACSKFTFHFPLLPLSEWMIMKQLQKKSREDAGGNSVAKYYQPLSLHSHVDTHCMRRQKFPPQKNILHKIILARLWEKWAKNWHWQQEEGHFTKLAAHRPILLQLVQIRHRLPLATFDSGLTRRQSYILRTKLTFRLIMLRVTLSMLDIASFATFQPIRGCFSLKSSSA